MKLYRHRGHKVRCLGMVDLMARHRIYILVRWFICGSSAAEHWRVIQPSGSAEQNRLVSWQTRSRQKNLVL